MTLLNEFDEFWDFCYKHGGTLKNHKLFGEMANHLRTELVKVESNKVGFPGVEMICKNCGDKIYKAGPQDYFYKHSSTGFIGCRWRDTYAEPTPL